MRMLFGLLVILVVSVGTVGNDHARNAIAETASQASPSATPTCIIPPAAQCELSKGKHQFIRWQAPQNEDLYVCFIDPSPFSKGYFHVTAGKYEDTKFKWFAKKGSFQYSAVNQDCAKQASDKHRATARVIIED
jgi:hypothetical protein